GAGTAPRARRACARTRAARAARPAARPRSPRSCGASTVRSRARVAAFEDRLELVQELRDVLELAVDAGEADVGDLVEVLELLHHQVADDRARHLAVVLLVAADLDAAGG